MTPPLLVCPGATVILTSLMTADEIEYPRFADHSDHINAMVKAALQAADAEQAVERHLRRRDQTLLIGPPDRAHAVDLSAGRILLVAAGKAAVPMTRGALKVIGDNLAGGVVITKAGGRDWQAETSGWPVPVHEGGHPFTDEAGLRATEAVVALLRDTSATDTVICLLSGGASALLAQPALPVEDYRRLTKLLQNSGCTIGELNTLRRAVDRIKAGGLAQLAQPATTHSLILSDVIGNSLREIGSGPTVTAQDRVSDIVNVLGKYDIARRVEREQWQRLADALKQVSQFRSAQTIRPVVYNTIVGDVSLAATGAQVRAIQLGFLAQLLTIHMEGEARETARMAAAITQDTPPNHCFIMGGETTVTVRGKGEGGRNLEAALAAALALHEIPRVAYASFATDGDDGRSPAAGAMVTGETVTLARAHGLDAAAYLKANDSYTFFRKLDEATGPAAAPHLIISGPSGTNVNDLMLLLAYDR